MICYPRRIRPTEYNPDDDPTWGIHDGVAKPSTVIPPCSTLEYLAAIGRKAPDYERVMAKLRNPRRMGEGK
jgi:hypothetical protein